MATMEELLSGTHEHEVLDTDSRFFVDATTRSISSGYPTKTQLIQGDHNSERFEFEIPRWIEEHDMSLCDKVEVHYININTEASSRDERSITGLYEVCDMRVDPDDENLVVCSWLIDYHATQFVGPLNFLLCFKCEKDGVISYAWHTAPYVGVSIISGINADETFEDDYCDVIERWKDSVMSALYADLQTTVSSVTTDIAAWKEEATDMVLSEAQQLVSEQLADNEQNVNAALAEWGETLDVERVRINELVATRATGGELSHDINVTSAYKEEVTGSITSNGTSAVIAIAVKGYSISLGVTRVIPLDLPAELSPIETICLTGTTTAWGFQRFEAFLQPSEKRGATLTITPIDKDVTVTQLTVWGSFTGTYPLANVILTELTDARVGLDEQGEEKAYPTVEENILAAHNKAQAAHNKAQAAQQMAADTADLADDFNRDITTLYNEIEALKKAARISYVDLPSSGWQGTESPYSQVVAVEGATENSQVDLTPSVEQLSIFYHKDLAFVTENEDGVVTVYAIGQKPANDYRIQVTITEVVR